MPRNSQNEHNQQLPIMFGATLGSHCKANIVVRSDSIAIHFFVGFLRHHVEFTQFVFYHLSKLIHPRRYFIGGGAGYRPRVQNDYFTTDSESSPLYGAVIINPRA